MPQRSFYKAWLTLLAPLLVACQGQIPPNLGLTPQGLRPCPQSPNCYASASAGAWPWKGALTDTQQALLLAAAQLGNNEVKTAEGQYLHLVFHTPLLGFLDDVEFWINAPRGEVEFISASRLGWHDLGANRRRMQALERLYRGRE